MSAFFACGSFWILLSSSEALYLSLTLRNQRLLYLRWTRARTRAAKVGKGLSKDAKARKLALQHWLEAIDPRHRYGHNLQFYCVNWLHCQSKQPFFYWLDIGEGKETSLERCPRSKLQQQCIKYLGPAQREAYEVVIKDVRFFYKQSGELLDTEGGPKDAKWIFVLSTLKTLYVSMKKKGTFQHSSFLAGGATLSAGRLVVEDGILKAVWPHSGHYLPTEENFQEFMSFLREQNVDLTDLKKSPAEDEEEKGIFKKSNSTSVRNPQLNADFCLETDVTNVERLSQENMDLRGQDSNANLRTSKLSSGFLLKITKLEIPTKEDAYKIFEEGAPSPSDVGYESAKDSFAQDDGYESAEDSFLTEEDFMFPKLNLFDEDEEEDDEEPVPKEKIFQRINSHKGMKSYQLAKQLSCRWTTGAGPRIGCMRGYPTELQLRVLEYANLSPRKGTRSANSTPRFRSSISPKNSLPASCPSPKDSATCVQKETTSRSHLSVGQEVTDPEP